MVSNKEDVLASMEGIPHSSGGGAEHTELFSKDGLRIQGGDKLQHGKEFCKSISNRETEVVRPAWGKRTKASRYEEGGGKSRKRGQQWQ